MALSDDMKGRLAYGWLWVRFAMVGSASAWCYVHLVELVSGVVWGLPALSALEDARALRSTAADRDGDLRDHRVAYQKLTGTTARRRIARGRRRDSARASVGTAALLRLVEDRRTGDAPATSPAALLRLFR